MSMPSPVRTSRGHVEVALRVRPMLPPEVEKGETEAVTVLTDDSRTGLPAVQVIKPAAAPSTAVEQGKLRRRKTPDTAARRFLFDAIAGPSVSQEELFHMLDIPGICDEAFAGRAVTVFCFGQTGSGKTYTLSGQMNSSENESANMASALGIPPAGEENGLQFQAARYIAAKQQRLRNPPPPSVAVAPPQPASRGGSRRSNGATPSGGKKNAKETHGGKRAPKAPPSPSPPAAASPVLPSAAATPPLSVTLKASYIELYNEHLFDLLQEGKAGLRCRWSAAAQSFFVEESLVVQCESEEDLLVVLREGHAYRHRAAHRLNADSSRSHAIFTVFVETQETLGEGGEGSAAHPARPPVRYGKITFVDLAGSERLKSTGSTGTDTKSINRSLFALGNVIEKLSALSEHPDRGTAATASTGSTASGAEKTDKGFIPYRSSILTQLLMDSLNGQSRTLMIACVSPARCYVDESLRTLHYAQRARHIATQPVTRLNAEDALRLQMEREVRRLRRENALLRAALRIPAAGAGEDEAELTSEVIQSHLSVLLARAPAVHAPPAPAPWVSPPRPATTEEARHTRGTALPGKEPRVRVPRVAARKPASCDPLPLQPSQPQHATVSRSKKSAGDRLPSLSSMGSSTPLPPPPPRETVTASHPRPSGFVERRRRVSREAATVVDDDDDDSHEPSLLISSQASSPPRENNHTIVHLSASSSNSNTSSHDDSSHEQILDGEGEVKRDTTKAKVDAAFEMPPYPYPLSLTGAIVVPGAESGGDTADRGTSALELLDRLPDTSTLTKRTRPLQ